MGEAHARATVTIERTPEEVIAVLRDIAAQHRWWPGQYLSEPLETDRWHRVTRARIGNDVKVAKDEFEVAYTHERGTAGYSWVLASRSAVQKSQAGSWRVSPAGAGSEVTLELTLDSGLPIPGFLLRRTIEDTVKGATRGLKRHCEA